MEDLQTVSLWLRDLNITISNFEDDFSNGYLLGQILYRYNFQDNFGQFSNKPNSSLANISKVQVALERFSLKFDPHRIINKEPGYAKKLLEKMHRALHTLHNSPQAALKKRSISDIPLITKEEKLAAKVKKFEDFRLAQAEKVLESEKKQRDLIFQSKLKDRSYRIETLKANKTFMQTWQHEGMQNWLKNQQRKKARVHHDTNVKMKLLNDKKGREKAVNDIHIYDTNEGISEFERNMIRLGIDYSGDTEKKVVKQDLAVEAAATMAKIKENKVKNLEAAKEREVRQRNAYIEQKKNEKFELYKQGSGKIGSSLIKILTDHYKHAFLKIFSCYKRKKKVQEVEKNISLYHSITEEKWGQINRKRLEELEALEFSAKKENIDKRKNINNNAIENLKKAHLAHSKLCKPIAIDLILLAEKVFDQLKNNQKIPAGLWKEWLKEFQNKDETSSTEIKPRKDVVFEEKEQDFTGSAHEEVEKYIEGKEEWGPVPMNYAFGDIMENIIEIAFPLSPPPSVPEGPHYLPLKIIVIGPAFSGKKSQVKKLADNFGLKIFEMGRIIEDAKKVIQKKSEPEDLKKKRPVEEESEAFIQTCLEVSLDDEYGKSKLFRAKIRGIFGDAPKPEQEEVRKQGKKEEAKSQGLILSGYPTTLQEAVDLERCLSGFVHPSELPTEMRDIKKKETSVLVKPTPKENMPVKLFNSAWDAIIWLDLDENMAVKRAADRRIDPAGNIYNLSVNPPPDNILARCKVIDNPTEEQIRTDYSKFNSHKDSLMHWFSLFGLKNTPIFYISEASQSPDQVFDNIKGKIHEILSTKTSSPPLETLSEPQLSKDIALELFTLWEQVQSRYLQSINKSLFLFTQLWKDLTNSLSSLQNNFLELFKQDDDKISIATNFIPDFNYFISKKSVFSKPETEELYERIDSISDELWDIVNKRKQNFVQKRENIISNYTLNEKLLEICSITLSLCKAELYKYSKTTNIIFKYKNICEGYDFPIQELDVPLEAMLPAKDFIKEVELKFSCIIYQYSFLKEENDLYICRVLKICRWAEDKCVLFRKRASEVFDKFDQWIVQDVHLENDAINKYVEALHESFRVKTQAIYEFPKNSHILQSLKAGI